MFQIVRRTNTFGGLKRYHERAAKFSGSYMVGPALLGNGQMNVDLALRFGTYPGKQKTTQKVLGLGFTVHYGRDVREYMRLSDGEYSSVTVGKIAIAKRYTKPFFFANCRILNK